MWKEKISLTLSFLIITNIINCDLIVDGDETLKAEELLLTKIEDDDDSLVKAFNQKVTKNNLLSPLLFQMQRNLQLMPMHIPSMNLGQPSPLNIPNLMYSNAAFNVMGMPNFQMNAMNNQPLLVNLPGDMFSNTYKDPYENYNHLLRDNALDELLFKQIMRDLSNYNFIYPSHQQMVPGIPVPYVPSSNFGRVAHFPVSINSANYATPNFQTDYGFQNDRFYSNLGQQGSAAHQNGPLEVYSQQQENLYGEQINAFNYLNNPIMKHLYKGARDGPLDIEIIKAIGYALPEQVSSYHPDKFERFLDASGSTTSQQIYADQKGTRGGPSDIEIIKSVGYALPVQVSSYQPDKLGRFLDASGSTRSQRKYAESKGGTGGSPNLEIIKTVGYALPEEVSTYYSDNYESVPNKSGNIPNPKMYTKPISTNIKHMYNNRTINSNKNNNMQLQYQIDNSKGHKEMETIKSRVSNQYYHSNRKPITFDNYYAELPENLEIIHGKIKKLVSPTTDLKHSNVLGSQRPNLRRNHSRMSNIDDNVAEDTNVNIEIKLKTNNKNLINKM